MFYHDQCNRVVADFRAHFITKKDARGRLGIIEERAYKRIPDAEPDGDITYCVACAIDEIEEIAAANNPIEPTS